MSRKSEELIKKYLNHTCTPEERAIVESWYNSEAEASESEGDNVDYEQLDKDIWNALRKTETPVRKIHWPLVAAAAACVIICCLFYYTGHKTDVPKSVAASANTLLPGSNKAELLLEDGSVLPLTDEKTGLLTKQNGAVINKLEGGRLSYDASQPAIVNKVTFNTLRTPRGGQYQVDLPDGTKAWLNAASSLKFPTIFNGSERIVEITGEVYFEVAVNKRKPFKVISRGQTIEVLGTHFNVNAYPDEHFIRTTLIEGSVSVSTGKQKVVIKPGEETLLNSDTQQIRIRKIDVEGAIAWKQGYFQFNDEDVKSIMRKLSRWYDIEVDYTKDFEDQRFSGSVSRFEEAAKVLKMLEYTGTVHFKIEGRRVTVMP